MAKNSKNYRKKELQISQIEKTRDRLTGRAGLALFMEYLHAIEIFPWLQRFFGTIRKNRKGLCIFELFKQVLCFMVDGTSRRLSYFDQLKKDAGYAATIETHLEHMASSHTMKRFFKAFAWTRIYLFRRLLQRLFIWRLRIKNPDIIELGLDTMVMDNDDAPVRHGVKPTYKKKKGFQPLQMNWGRLIIDAVFRGGDKHSNHGRTAEQMIRHIVGKIRKEYRADVPIIIRMDSGFFDQKLFMLCESLNVGYICGGKLYDDITLIAQQTPEDNWQRLCNKGEKELWEYFEFGQKRGNWVSFRRSFYCRLMNKGKQLCLAPFRKATIMVTNLGQGQPIDEMLSSAGYARYLKPQSIIAAYHERGSDELANRALKDFGHEQLPFKRFSPNAAWYYTMLLGHFLLETFKEDIGAPLIPVGAYATTVRRKLIDIAGKIVSHGRKVTLKIVAATFEALGLDELFARCRNAPPIQQAAL